MTRAPPHQARPEAERAACPRVSSWRRWSGRRASTASCCGAIWGRSSARATTCSSRSTTPGSGVGRSSTSRRGVTVEAPISLASVQAESGTLLNARTSSCSTRTPRPRSGSSSCPAEDDLDGVVNVVTELIVGQNAQLRYVCGQGLSERSWIFGAQRAEVGRDATLDWVALGFGGRGGHVRMETRLGGEGADARVTGAYASHGRQHIDFDTTQEHAAPNTTSDLAFRGVLQGRSSAVWKGNIIVDPGAQKTDAFQESRNLLHLQARPRRRHPRPGDPGQRRPLHPRGRGRPGRPGAALLSALARAASRSRPSAWSSRASCRRWSSASRRVRCARCWPRTLERRLELILAE